ncbi:hypothetical protein Tco_1582000, partial [Tanacetum coccineum]
RRSFRDCHPWRVTMVMERYSELRWMVGLYVQKLQIKCLHVVILPPQKKDEEENLRSSKHGVATFVVQERLIKRATVDLPDDEEEEEQTRQCARWTRDEEMCTLDT